MRFYCASAVVLIHAFGAPLSGTTTVAFQNGIYDFIRIFFSQGICRVSVPIFLMISGYLFFSKLREWDNTIWFSKVKKRVRSLLIPYILWNIISIVFSFVKVSVISRDPGAGLTILDFKEYFDQNGGFLAFWDRGIGALPHNYPLRSIRDLFIVVLFSPVVFSFVKRTKLVGLTILYCIYVIQPKDLFAGFSTEAFVFFSLGAYLQIHNIDFATFFSKRIGWSLCVSIPILVIMVVMYGNNMPIWHLACRLFRLFGAFSIIGLVAMGIKHNYLKVNPTLSGSAFLIYAGHGTIILPILQYVLDRISAPSQLYCLFSYFATAFLAVLLLVLSNHLLSRFLPRFYSVLTGGRTVPNNITQTQVIK